MLITNFKMPRIFYISSRVATQSPVLKTCHSKLNNLVAGNDAMKPLAVAIGIYCTIIFRTPVHISAITIFYIFQKHFNFPSVWPARGRRMI